MTDRRRVHVVNSVSPERARTLQWGRTALVFNIECEVPSSSVHQQQHDDDDDSRRDREGKRLPIICMRKTETYMTPGLQFYGPVACGLLIVDDQLLTLHDLETNARLISKPGDHHHQRHHHHHQWHHEHVDAASASQRTTHRLLLIPAGKVVLCTRTGGSLPETVARPESDTDIVPGAYAYKATGSVRVDLATFSSVQRGHVRSLVRDHSSFWALAQPSPSPSSSSSRRNQPSRNQPSQKQPSQKQPSQKTAKGTHIDLDHEHGNDDDDDYNNNDSLDLDFDNDQDVDNDQDRASSLSLFSKRRHVYDDPTTDSSDGAKYRLLNYNDLHNDDEVRRVIVCDKEREGQSVYRLDVIEHSRWATVVPPWMLHAGRVVDSIQTLRDAQPPSVSRTDIAHLNSFCPLMPQQFYTVQTVENGQVHIFVLSFVGQRACGDKKKRPALPVSAGETEAEDLDICDASNLYTYEISVVLRDKRGSLRPRVQQQQQQQQQQQERQ